MASGDTASAQFSLAEITAAIRALGLNELARLRIIARWLARISPVDADELVDEACCRAMEGVRICPRDVQLVPFLAGIMRSIASDAAKFRKRHPEQPLETLTAAGRDWSDSAITAEQGLIEAEDLAALIRRATETKHQILALFDDDLVAQTIAEGIMDGLDGEELRALTELDKTAFDSKRRLIRRRIAKAFPTSAKP